MIITGLKAENFRKYQQLQLDNLPERGVIAITGSNESGKSSIGDAVQFALFGRTSQLMGTETTKLILWGTDKATVTLRLQHREHEYRLTRSINSAGEMAATLFSTEESSTLADSPQSVAQQLRALLGYHYGAFAKAFYWSDQQKSATQRDTDNLLKLAGLQEYAHLVDELKHDIAQHQQHVDEIAIQQQNLQNTITTLPVATDHLPELHDLSRDINDQQQSLLQLGKNIDKAAETYPNQLENYQNLNARQHKISRWTTVSLVVFLLCTVFGIILLIDSAWQSMGITTPDATTRDWLGGLCIRLASLAAIAGAAFLVYGWYLDMKYLQPLEKQAETLKDTLYTGYQTAIKPVAELLQPSATTYFSSEKLGVNESVLDTERQAELAQMPEWLNSIPHYTSKPLHLLRATDTLHQVFTHQHATLGHYAALLQTDIDTEESKIHQRDEVQNVLWELEEAEQQERRAQVVAHTAIDLLKRDSSHSIARFNKLVQTHCTQLLQEFTQSHYKTLELHPDFSIQVLSEEKGDFLEFSEMSAGTQRQIALALQLALANALADATKAQTQLIFLDEPFAFFDPERTQTALASLQDSTQKSLSQIWLTTQVLPEHLQSTKFIQCPSGAATLHIV